MAEHAHEHDYSRGYVDGLLRRKHLEHDAVEAARIELARRGPGGREHFADPRPGDAGLGDAARRARASWEPLGLGPGPGWVHLGGPPVHHHRCADACYAYRPGWYRISEAIAIIGRLPGDYRAVLAQLRSQQAAEAA